MTTLTSNIFDKIIGELWHPLKKLLGLNVLGPFNTVVKGNRPQTLHTP